MISKFEEWRSTTPFAGEAFFESYVKYLEGMELAKRPLSYVYDHQLKNIKTTPLMSRLNYTRDNEDLNLDVLILNICSIDIVVIQKLPFDFSVFLKNSVSMTMTELKKMHFNKIVNIDKERSVRKVNWDDQTFLNVWSAPLHLRAATYGNKGFMEKRGDCHFSCWGNQYGDTCYFYIIGSLTPKENEHKMTPQWKLKNDLR